MQGGGSAAAVDPSVPSPVVEVRDSRLVAHGVTLLLKRDDLIHLSLPGNKWRKLKYNLDEARRRGTRTLLTFGGAYSNHIRAVAAAGELFGFSTIGLIRGEEHQPLNASLAYAVKHGMRLAYLDRSTYRLKHTEPMIASLHRQWGDFYLLPEGGSNELAVRSCAEIPAEIDIEFDVICCPVGTGGTLAGIAAGLQPEKRALGFAALKGAQFLEDDVEQLQRRTFGNRRGDWSINFDFHCGGFAKRTNDLDQFVADFADRHGIVLDWVYVAKMMFGIYTLTAQGKFEPGIRIVAVVTGPDFDTATL